MGGAPPLSGVLETVLYFIDEKRTEYFYTSVMGFRPIGKEPGRSLFYRAGASVFLLFDAAAARVPDKSPPPHGAEGPIHTCFEVPPAAYEAWKRHLASHGVALVREVDWPRGRSFYFEDPSGNVLEIADADIWPA